MNRTRFASALAMAALATILLPSILTAQIRFERTYGGGNYDGGESVQQTADSGYIVAGYTMSFGAGGKDVYLVKTDANGDTIWTRTYGGGSDDLAHSVQQTADGGYIIAGTTFSYDAGGGDVYLIKTDMDGSTIWTKTFGDTSVEAGYSVQQTSDSGYIITGLTSPADTSQFCFLYLIRTDATGDTLWTRTFGGPWSGVGYSVIEAADGSFVVAGSTGGRYSTAVYIIKTDANGNRLWDRTYGRSVGNCQGYSIRQTTDGGYIITGFAQDYYTEPEDVYLVRTNADGDTIWTRTYGGALDDVGRSVQQTTDGGYVVTGYTYPNSAGYRYVYLIRTDMNGDTLWTKTFGGGRGDGDDGWSVHQTLDGGYVITGSTGSFGAGREDVYLIKTDSLGNAAVAEPKTSPTRAPSLSLTCEPNPCRSSTVLHLTAGPLDHSTTTLRVYDSQGRLVHSSFGIRVSSFRLDLRSMPAGAYFVRCDAAGEHATARVVLQR